MGRVREEVAKIDRASLGVSEAGFDPFPERRHRQPGWPSFLALLARGNVGPLDCCMEIVADSGDPDSRSLPPIGPTMPADLPSLASFPEPESPSGRAAEGPPR